MYPPASTHPFSPRSICLLGAFLLLGLGPLLLIPDAPPRRPVAPPLGPRTPKLVATYGKLPLSFEANHGQTNPKVNFLARGPGYSLFLTPTEAVLSLHNSLGQLGRGAEFTPSAVEGHPPPATSSKASQFGTGAEFTPPGAGHPPDTEPPGSRLGEIPRQHEREAPPTVVRMKLLGANPAPRITGLDALPGKSNYFLGNDPAQWRTNVPTFARVRYQEVYPGIDLIYYGQSESRRSRDADPALLGGVPLAASNPARPALLGGVAPAASNPVAPATGLEYDFIVAPGRSAAEIPVHRDAEASYHTGMGLEFDFAVSPGADPSLIRLAIEGAEHLALDPNGDLIVYLVAPASGGTGTGGTASGGTGVSPVAGEVRLHKPRIYQSAAVTPSAAEGSASSVSVSAGRGLSGRGGDPALFAGNPAVRALEENGAFRREAQPSGDPASSLREAPEGKSHFSASRSPDSVGAEIPLALPALSTVEGSLPRAESRGEVEGRSVRDFASFASVSGSFVLRRHNQVGFELGPYDPTRPLIIDPVLSYSTFLGGTSSDSQREGDIAVDAAGNVYVTGDTRSTNFPTSNPFQATLGGVLLVGDAFVTKFNADGVLVYSTYLGGSRDDEGQSIAVDAAGNVYVTGATDSTNFPTKNPFQGALSSSGEDDAFVAKLDPTGSALVFSTYLGGSREDEGRAIAVDAAGNAYVMGFTRSDNFPTQNPFQATRVGGTCGFDPCADAFVTKFNAAGSALIYSTYLGGGGNEIGDGIAVDTSGNAYVTGLTSSTNFPTTPGAFDTTFGGSEDVFVTKLNPAGSALVYSTYLGGSGIDEGTSIAVDTSGNAYVQAFTGSTNFPTTPAAFQTSYGGGFDTTVTKLNPAGSALVFSTYLGGSFIETGGDIAVDPAGNVYVTGYSQSNFPTASPLQSAYGGGSFDAFVSKFNADGALLYSTQLGGSDQDGGRGIAVDAAGNAYVTGQTRSPNFPTTPGAFQTTIASTTDAFVAKISDPEVRNPVPRIASLSPGSAAVAGPAFTLAVNGIGFVSASSVRWNDSDRPTTFVSGTQLTAAIPASDLATAGTATVRVFNPTPGGGLSNVFSFSISNPIPTLTSLSPTGATASTPGLTLTVNGSNFVSNSVVRWNGLNRTTTFVSSTQLTGAITATDLASGGTAQVTVFNPSPGGGTSNALTFTATNPAPAVSSISPASAAVAGAAFDLTVTGVGFVSGLPGVFGSVVRRSGVSRTTTFVSSTTLIARISATDLAVAGTAQITVFNPTPGGGTSTALSFTTTSTPPTATILPSTPFTRIIPHFITGLGFVTKMTLANLSASENPIIVNFVSQAGTLVETQTHTLAPAATIRIETLESVRFTTPTTRWAVVGSQFAVGVNLFFELKGSASNAIITTVGFNDVPAVSSFTLPVELEPARTGDPAPRTVGLAIANVSNSSNTVTLRLHNQSGTLLATETMTLAPFAQNAFNVENLASFRAALPTGNFIGVVQVSATSPVSAIGVGDDFGPFFSTPIIAGQAGTLLVPHVVTGDGFVTKMTVVNLSASSNPIVLKFFNQAGALLETRNFTLGPNASQRIATPESERFTTPTTRWATVEAQQPAGVNLFFELTQPASPLIVTTVGFNDVAGLAEFTLPLEFEPARTGDPAPRTVGLALANNSASSSSVTLKLLDRSGAVQATHNLTLNPLSQTAFNVENLSSFRPVVPAANFIGTLTVLATTPLSAIGVGDDFGPFFSIPIIPGRAR